MKSTMSQPDRTDLDEARDLDRALNATTDPGEMRTLISRRRLVRAALDFDQAMRDFEAENPVVLGPERFSIVIPAR